jgi:glycosyltransferase involved in cell wall biosynthesis
MSGPPPRVALVSIGIGRVQRGFERYFTDLFGVLQGPVALTLFKSAGPATAHQRVPRGLWPLTHFIRALPKGRWFDRLFGRSEYHRDCLAYALVLLPLLRRSRFDVVHVIDPPLAAVLALARRLRLLRVPLLFTEGAVMPPVYYPRVDHIHHVGFAALQAGLDHGVPPGHMTLVPCGLHTQRFAAAAHAEAAARARTRAGAGPGDLVVLCIAALKRDHKRVDHVIEEVARLPGPVQLWLDGHPEEDAVAELARQRLGARCRITHVPSAEVPALYGAADVLVHAALEESFGLSLVEAACAGLPVVAHDSPHFRWLLGDDGQFVDMAAPGLLARHLQAWMALPHGQRQRPDASRMQARYDWAALALDYARLYARVAGRPADAAIS